MCRSKDTKDTGNGVEGKKYPNDIELMGGPLDGAMAYPHKDSDQRLEPGERRCIKWKDGWWYMYNVRHTLDKADYAGYRVKLKRGTEIVVEKQMCR